MNTFIRSLCVLACVLTLNGGIMTPHESAFAAESVAAKTSEIEGEIVKIVPAKREIYVLSAEKKHEYYFNDTTTVTKGDSAAQFDDLKTGMKVKVTANKIGKRLDPTAVKILE